MKQRIEYIDIAKGILILLVVFHHTPQVGNRLLMLNSDSLQVMDNYNWIYSTFFMPTFFIITGYCSNFFINIKCFLWRNFKTIIGAGVTLSIIEGFVNNTLDHSFVYTVSLIPIIEKFFTHGTVYWFLTTLFVCKVGYYLLARYCRFIYIQGIIAVIFLCVAIMISPHIDKRDSNNYWYFLHSMFFLVFVWIGAMMRMYNLLEKKGLSYIGVSYFIVLLTCNLIGIDIPRATHGINVKELSQIPLYLFLAITGSILTLNVAKCISTSTFLSYIGRISLIIYTLHITILKNIEIYINKYLVQPIDIKTTAIFYVAVLLLTMITAICFSKVLCTKHFKWLTGKW